mmetsp:Transcript_87634/g.283717  ORF Transcript_87634/g.283717 Transcript_87634/m.283717 type:complete len:229 (-) Transcript_87634:532-1218(-)
MRQRLDLFAEVRTHVGLAEVEDELAAAVLVVRGVRVHVGVGVGPAPVARVHVVHVREEAVDAVHDPPDLALRGRARRAEPLPHEAVGPAGVQALQGHGREGLRLHRDAPDLVLPGLRAAGLQHALRGPVLRLAARAHGVDVAEGVDAEEVGHGDAEGAHAPGRVAQGLELGQVARGVGPRRAPQDLLHLSGLAVVAALLLQTRGGLRELGLRLAGVAVAEEDAAEGLA